MAQKKIKKSSKKRNQIINEPKLSLSKRKNAGDMRVLHQKKKFQPIVKIIRGAVAVTRLASILRMLTMIVQLSCRLSQMSNQKTVNLLEEANQPLLRPLLEIIDKGILLPAPLLHKLQFKVQL